MNERGVADVYSHGETTYAYLGGSAFKQPSQQELIRVLEQARGPEPDGRCGWSSMATGRARRNRVK